MAKFVYIYVKERDSQVNDAKVTNAKNAGANRTIPAESGADFVFAFDDLKKNSVKIGRLDVDSHGSPGVLDFRGDRVDFETLGRNFKGKGYEDLFDVDARVWIYGCNIAAVGEDPKLNGRKFLEEFARTFLFKSGGRVTGSTRITTTVPRAGKTFFPDSVHALIKKGGTAVRLAEGQEVSSVGGKWEVTADGKDWEYHFLQTGGPDVFFQEDVIFGGSSGKGKWQQRSDVVHIDWESGSSEEWDLPLYDTLQTGLWHKTDGSTAGIVAHTLHWLSGRIID